MKLPLKVIKTGKKKTKGAFLVVDDNDDLIANLLPVLYDGDVMTSIASMAQARGNAEENAYKIVNCMNAIPYIKDYLASRIEELDSNIDSPLPSPAIAAHMRERLRVQNLLGRIL